MNEIATQSLEKNLQADVLLYGPTQDLMGNDHDDSVLSEKRANISGMGISNQQPSGRLP